MHPEEDHKNIEPEKQVAFVSSLLEKRNSAEFLGELNLTLLSICPSPEAWFMWTAEVQKDPAVLRVQKFVKALQNAFSSLTQNFSIVMQIFFEPQYTRIELQFWIRLRFLSPFSLCHFTSGWGQKLPASFCS